MVFDQIKNSILGKRYDLSIAFVSPVAMRQAMKYKKKSRGKLEMTTSNVLAFPLSPSSGEILICKATARKEARSYSMDAETFTAYLFIHGLLHLKGLEHGATMEHEERRIMRRFDLRVHE